jgi:xanthine dehydrogenase small subunit
MGIDTVRYVHDGRIVSAPWRGNAHNLLQHLREQRGLTGTKEGCAEGDCGACLVIVGELDADGQAVRYRSANACFMPLSAMHGRLLITVEDLGRPSALHPVQQAMVQEHGSQCGFCTPGFVMSLYEHYLHHEAATSTDAVHEQLSGSLCRCTGYAPILRAAKTMFALPRVDRDRRADLDVLLKLSTETQDDRLESGGEVAWLPRSSDAVAALRAQRPNSTLIGGSTDAGLWITKQLRCLPEVIQLGNVRDLKTVAVSPQAIVIGAATPLTDAFDVLNREFPELSQLWSRFASPAVRHQGTLGGNIANASPIGDSMPALLSLGARLVLRAGDVRRELPLEDFFLAYQRTALEPGEFIEVIKIPRRSPHLFLRGYKMSKRHDDDISAVCLCLALELDGDIVRHARFGVGGMAAMPRRAPQTEAALIGQPLCEATMHQVGRVLASEFTPISDHRASAAYRLKLASNLLVRAALEHAGVEKVRVTRIAGAAA